MIEWIAIAALVVAYFWRTYMWSVQREKIESLEADNANLLGSFEALKPLHEKIEDLERELDHANEKLQAAVESNEKLINKIYRYRALFENFKDGFEGI